MNAPSPPAPPSATELRSFGLILGGFVIVVAGFALPFLLGRPFPRWPWFVGAGFIAWALTAPASLAPVHTGFIKFGSLASKITTPLLMTGVFFLTIVPTALAMRAFRRDALHRKLDPKATTYRVVHDPEVEKSLDNPF